MRLTWLCLLLVGVALAQEPAEPATTPATTSAAPTTTAAGATTTKPAAGGQDEVKPAEPGEEDRSAKPAAQGAGPQAGAAQNADVRAAGGNETEECEEAWEYLEFLKTNIKEKIEVILQETLFEPRALLEQTVADTMTQTLEIRDAILTRTKALRSADGTINICAGQGVNQEQFLTLIRMDVMGVLLKLIEPNSATPEKLQEIGKELLAVRSKVNAEITRIIMLRESKGPSPQTRQSECDCGILKEISEGLEEVVDSKGNDTTVQMMTMLLMTVDGRIGILYNEILGQLDEVKRKKATDELKSLKEISTSLNDVISKMLSFESKTPEGATKLERVVERDVPRIRSDVDRQLQACRKACPSDCESCGAKKIEVLSQKLTEYKTNLEELEEEESKESIRGDLMQYLTTANQEMTELLTEKANSGNLTECQAEELEVLEKVKGPLWMMVNITIFGDVQTMKEMLEAIEAALAEMGNEYCSTEAVQQRVTGTSDECDQEEITNTRKWISDIDTIIANSIFKLSDDKGRVNAMLGFIELKSNMDDRVRALFTENLKCREEVEQIKNVYMNMVTGCLAEMMNPKFRFELVPRAERVQCIKQLRVTMEDRRGELLLREVERRISQENLVTGEGGSGTASEKPAAGAGAGDSEGAEVISSGETTTKRA